MSKPFDATLRTLLEVSPAAWPVLIGQRPAPTEVIDADVSTVTGGADKVLRVRDTPEYLLHLEFQAGPDQSVPTRTHRTNAILGERHDRLVRSVVVLLRPKAQLSTLNGIFQKVFPGEPPYLTFRYQILPVWQLPVEQLLGGAVGLLPLAPISAVSEAQLPGVLARMQERLRQEPKTVAQDLWTAAYVLLGLYYDSAWINQLLREVMGMKESNTYMAIIEKGEVRGALREIRKTLLLQGTKRFGPPTPAVAAAVEAIDDLDRLEQLSLRLLDVNSWEELLRPPHASEPAGWTNGWRRATSPVSGTQPANAPCALSRAGPLTLAGSQEH